MIEWITDFLVTCWDYFKAYLLICAFIGAFSWCNSHIDANPKKENL